MKRIVVLLALLWGFSAFGQSDTLYVSTSQVVHLRFASDLKYLSLGDRVLVARIVDGAKDFVAVRARARFDFVTSMSCLESTGQMHSFVVAYAERPERLEVDTRIATGEPVSADGSLSATINLEELANRPQELFHLGVRDYGISLLCENVFVKEDVLVLVFSLENSSAVSYSVGVPRFAVESRKRTKRGLQYEKAVVPRLSYGLGNISPGDSRKMAFAFDKVSLTRGQVLRVFFYESDGARNFVLTLGMNDVNKAKRLK